MGMAKGTKNGGLELITGIILCVSMAALMDFDCHHGRICKM